MSEDIDIKFLAKPDIAKLSNNKRKNLKKGLKTDIINLIEANEVLSVADSRSRNEGSNRMFLVDYPNEFTHTSLRSRLKLEFTEIGLFRFPAYISSVGSIYERETGQKDEITNIPCDTIENILIEKLISLLRRTAKVARGASFEDDETLVRHIYDLFFIVQNGYDESKVNDQFKFVVEYDKQQFGNNHKEFASNPNAELHYGLDQILNNPMHEKRYANFLGPLVYNPKPPTWQQGIKNIKNLATKFIN